MTFFSATFNGGGTAPVTRERIQADPIEALAFRAHRMGRRSARLLPWRPRWRGGRDEGASGTRSDHRTRSRWARVRGCYPDGHSTADLPLGGGPCAPNCRTMV